MDLFSRFKKDYFNYLLSVILPALIMGLSIPVLKHLLGAKGYGSFAIWFNGVLICAASLTGWIMQSILRFYTTAGNKKDFVDMALRISYQTQFILFLPIFFTAWYISGDWMLALCFVFAFIVVSLQFSILAISQSGFLSKKNIYSETIRALSYMGVAIGLLSITGLHYLYALFIAVVLSYLLSVLYLKKQISLSLVHDIQQQSAKASLSDLSAKFLKYGAPLSVWFAFAYLTSYIDKLFMAKNLGLETQGNYQAIFDFLSRSLALIISPVTTSLFPILTLAFRKGELGEMSKLIKKIVLYELAGFLVVGILYWLFGANILFTLLKIPSTSTYKMIGFIVIAGTFVWQISMVLQKRYELRFLSLLLLGMIAISISVQLILYIFFQKQNNVLLYPIGYLVSGMVYLIFVSYPVRLNAKNSVTK